MPIDIKTTNSDIVFENGKMQLVNDKAEILQSIENRLKTRKGEYFLDTTYGLDYTEIFSMNEKHIDVERQELAIRECLLQDNRVSRVIDVNVEQHDREANISFKIEVEGTGELEGGITIG